METELMKINHIKYLEKKIMDLNEKFNKYKKFHENIRKKYKDLVKLVNFFLRIRFLIDLQI